MNAETMMYVVSVFVLASWLYFLVRRRWNLAAANGPGFFLGHEVGAEFQGRAAPLWTTRYHAALVAELAIILLAGVGLVASGQWRWLPAWAGGMAVLYRLSDWSFRAWLRRSLPAPAPGASPKPVALSLETRRLRDYLSMTSELLSAVVLVSSWALLLVLGSSGWRWQMIAVWTYLAVVSTAWKVWAVRAGIPIPSDRPREHHAWLDSRRRYTVRLLDCFSWLNVLIVAGYAAVHLAPGEAAAGWARMLAAALIGAAWLATAVVVERREARLAALGSGLRPVETWRGLSGRDRPVLAPRAPWTVAFVIGLVVFIAAGLLG